MIEIKKIEIIDQIAERDGDYSTNRFNLTRQSAPTNPAFIEIEALQAEKERC